MSNASISEQIAEWKQNEYAPAPDHAERLWPGRTERFINDLVATIDRLEAFVNWQFEEELDAAWDDYDAAITREAIRIGAKRGAA